MAVRHIYYVLVCFRGHPGDFWVDLFEHLKCAEFHAFKFHIPVVRNMVFFEPFSVLFFTTLYVVLPSHVLFSQFHSSRKDNTCAIEPMT